MITRDLIEQCLTTTSDYKNSKIIKQAVQDNQQECFMIICQTLKEVLGNNQYPPMTQLLALRLSKELIDIFNTKFIDLFENITLESLKQYAVYQRPSNDANRGGTYYGADVPKDIRQVGVSIVRMSLDCIKAWAMFFPYNQADKPRKFLLFYHELLEQNVDFPGWAYYKEEFVKEHQNNNFDRAVDLLKSQQIGQLIQSKPNLSQPDQPQKIGISSQQQFSQDEAHHVNPTPGGPTPMDPKEQIVLKGKQVLQICQNIKQETGRKCAQNLEYHKQQFSQIRDEALAKHSEMDLLVNDLIDAEEDELAGDIMFEMDNLKGLQDDIELLEQQPNFWNQFRKKYIGNNVDIALQQQQQQQQQQLLKQQQEQQRIQEENEIKRKQHEEAERLQKERERQQAQAQERERQQALERERQQALEKERQQAIQREKQLELERLQKLEIEKQQQEADRQKRIELERRQEMERQQEIERQQQEIDKQKRLEREKQQEIERQQALEQERIKKEKQLENEKEKQIINTNIQQQQFSQNQHQQSQAIEFTDQLHQQQYMQPNDEDKIHQLIGNVQQIDSNRQSQFGDQRQSRLLNSVQNKSPKPISHSSLGKKQQPTGLKIKGDITGAPEIQIEQRTQQQNPNNIQFYNDQIQLVQQTLDAVQNDNKKLRQSLQEKENENIQLRQQLSMMSNGNLTAADLNNQIEQLRREITQLHNQNRNLTDAKEQLEKQVNQSLQGQNIMKQQLLEGHESQLTIHKNQANQLMNEKQALSLQIEELRQHQIQNFDLQQKQIRMEQQSRQQIQQIEELQRQKELIQKDNYDQINILKHQISEMEQLINTLTEQKRLQQLQIEQNIKEKQIYEDQRKQLQEQSLKQIGDARRESREKQSQLDNANILLSEKDQEIRQLKQQLQTADLEIKQFKQNQDAEQQQFNQLVQIYKNGNKGLDSQSTSLLQNKLKQTLDEMDELKQKQQINLIEKDEYYQNKINDLNRENQQLKADIENLHQAAQQSALAALQKQIPPIKPPKSIQSGQNQSEGLIINPQFNNMVEDVSGNLGNFAQSDPQEAFAANMDYNIVQPQCPLPSFKHFAQIQQFQLPKLKDRQKQITQECLDLIFPYSDPQEYYQSKPKKNRKGRIVQSTSYSHEIANLDQKNRNLFKQRCLGSVGLLYVDNDFQYGLNYQTQNYQQKQYFTYGLYVTNINQRQDNFILQFLDAEQFIQFWALPIQYYKSFPEDAQELIEILAYHQKSPNQILTVQVKHSSNHPYQFYIPNHICQQIIYKDTRINDFRIKWKNNIQNQIRTELLQLNIPVFGDYQTFMSMIPRLILLNQDKINDFEIGIDELKIGGIGQYKELQFLIKFEIIPNNQICIYLTFEQRLNNKKQIFEQILQGYAFILSNGKQQ